MSQTYERVRIIECKLTYNPKLQENFLRGGVTTSSFYTCEFTMDNQPGEATELNVHIIEYQPDGDDVEHTKLAVTPERIYIDFDFYNKGKRANCTIGERFPFGISVFCREDY